MSKLIAPRAVERLVIEMLGASLFSLWWSIAFALFSFGCIYLGWTGRPKSLRYSALVGAGLVVISAGGWVPALNVVVVPFSAHYFMSRFRRGQMLPPALLSCCIGSTWGVALLDSEGWLPTVAMLLVLALTKKVAPRLSRRMLLVASSLPSVVVALYIALAGFTAGRQAAPVSGASQSMPGASDSPRPTSWLDSLAFAATFAVAIGLSMLWNKWRAQRAARQNEAGWQR